jgi:hypothetical protein
MDRIHVTVKQLVARESLQWLHCNDFDSVAVCVGGSNTAKMVFPCCIIGGRGKNRFVIVQSGRRGLGWHSRYSDSQWCGQSRDQIPVGARFSAPLHIGPGAYPPIYAMGTVCLSWDKVARAWRWSPTPSSSAEVIWRVEIYLCSLSWPSWPVLGWILPFTMWMESFWLLYRSRSYLWHTHDTYMGKRSVLHTKCYSLSTAFL